MALHKLTGHHVAVKIISKKKLQEKDPQSESKRASGSSYVAMHNTISPTVRREIKILSILQHPHILRMYEVVETRDHIYIVTEYVEGGELFDHITRVGRLPETEARHLFQQMIAGVVGMIKLHSVLWWSQRWSQASSIAIGTWLCIATSNPKTWCVIVRQQHTHQLFRFITSINSCWTRATISKLLILACPMSCRRATF